MIKIFDDDEKGPPIFIHKTLLFNYLDNPIGLDWMTIRNTSQKQLCLPLSRRECVLLARILYGQSLWQPDEDTTPDDDLQSFDSLYMIFEGRLHSHAGMNASLDAIRAILCRKDKIPENPLGCLFGNELPDSVGTWPMIKDLLIYSDCATDGRSLSWIEEYLLGTRSEVASRMCYEFLKEARTASPGDLKDPMQRCAYHKHRDGCKLCCEAIST